MCEIHAFVISDDRKEKIFESVNRVKTSGDEISLRNIYGEEKIIKARFLEYDMDSRMMLFKAL